MGAEGEEEGGVALSSGGGGRSPHCQQSFRLSSRGVVEAEPRGATALSAPVCIIFV